MAATRLIALHVNKGRTVVQCLGDRTDYATNPEKTEKGNLVTSYACDPRTVDEEFMLSKRQYYHLTGKTQKSDVIAYQIRQSFKPGEITPEEANRLGRELAMRFTKGDYAFIVATHTDRAHIHNHIIFNSTALDGTKKFKNFWLSGKALQRCSDLVCLENGYSVIDPKPYRDRQKRTDYPGRENLRDGICRDIDAALQRNPDSFEELLHMLQAMDYEIKYGKNISLKGKSQKRYIRLSSLPEGYQEAELRAHFTGNISTKGKSERTPQSKTNYQSHRQVNLIIDIQAKLTEKGPGYARWATVYNLKQMSKTLLFLRDNHIENLDQLDTIVNQKTAQRDELLASTKELEARLTEIAATEHTSSISPSPDLFRKRTFAPAIAENSMGHTGKNWKREKLPGNISMSMGYGNSQRSQI